MNFIIKSIGIQDIPEDAVQGFEYVRIGEANNERTRNLKVTVGNKTMRDKICKESSKVKLLASPWNKVYLNKDSHPVYVKEGQRLRKKMRELKARPGFEHQTGRVKIIKGLLQVDGNTVDRNLFQQ